MYRLSADQMGGTTSTIDVTTNSTVMLSLLHWAIPQYIVLAPTSCIIYWYCHMRQYNILILSDEAIQYIGIVG